MSNLSFKINNSQIDETSLEEYFDQLFDYHIHLAKILDEENWQANEASILLPFDQKLLEPIQEVVKNFNKDPLKFIFILGIGGSNLGTAAIYKSLVGRIDEFKSSEGKCPKLVFIDTIDARMIDDLKTIFEEQEIQLNQILINIVTKSGVTTEIIVNAELLLDLLKEKFNFDDVLDRVVVTTDRDSKLWKFAEENRLIKLEVPKKVGGRYSVFTAVGLLPIAMSGFDIHSLLEGAASLIEFCFEERNIAMESAVIQFFHYQKGIKIQNSFFLDPNLLSLGTWYEQLIAESLGKEFNLSGDVVHEGITPITSVGTTDFHSKTQLYLGGPRDKLTTFVNVKHRPESKLNEALFFDIVEGIKDKRLDEILNAFYETLKSTYQVHNLPFMEIHIDSVNEYFIGQFMQFKMLEVMYLGKLMNISAFNQPNIEEYKKEVRKVL
jgi:glucose-6-phosphate isomerase